MFSDLPPMFPGGCRIGVEEESAVLDVLRTRRLFRYYGAQDGPSAVEAFENEFGALIGSRYALAVASGTAALVAGLAALGVGPGDQVIVPSYTWISTAAAVLALGAVPMLAEVDESLTIDVADAEAQVTDRTKAIIPVHMRGAPAAMSAVLEMARRRGITVLEDAAQAAGGAYRGRRLGTLGDVGVFSLQYNKIITCGEGGVVVTDDDQLHARALMYHDVAGLDPIVGVTSRLSELHGAVARVQLRRLDGIIADCRANRRALEELIGDALRESGVTLRTCHDDAGDTGIALILLCPDADRARELVSSTRGAGLRPLLLFDPDFTDFHVAFHWSPILQKRAWSERGPWSLQDREVRYDPDRWVRTTGILGRAVQFDVSPDLTSEQVAAVGSFLSDALLRM
jgi:8-amino-3,8-dideoxy-alpha-D-manno-octulosonate transaminase